MAYRRSTDSEVTIKGDPDDALRFMAADATLSQARAARRANVCPMKLSRHIAELKKAGVFDTFMDLERANVAAAMPSPPPPPLPPQDEPPHEPPQEPAHRSSANSRRLQAAWAVLCAAERRGWAMDARLVRTARLVSTERARRLSRT